jgi:hypothetical protein
MLGKFATIFGPALMGIVGLAVKRILTPPACAPEQLEAIGRFASRCSIGSILILFLIGGVLFYFVDERKGKSEAALLAKQLQ